LEANHDDERYSEAEDEDGDSGDDGRRVLRYGILRLDCDEEEAGPSYLLPLIGTMEDVGIEGIVIEKVPGVRGEFRRVGWFDSRKPKDMSFLSTIAEDGPATAASVCAGIDDDPEFPGQRFVITIV
jgi:hypothetical protein